MTNENNTTTKPYIVKNADGVEYLLPYYPATFMSYLKQSPFGFADSRF